MKKEMGLNLAIAAAIVVSVCALLFMFLAPKPTVAGIAERERASEKKILGEADDAKKELGETEARLANWTWVGQPQQVGPSALNALTTLARQNRVKLSGFRPQRSTVEAGVELMPFAVTAEGAYPDVLRFVQTIESTGSKLIVDRVQIASAEANSNLVTAVVGITGYRTDKKE